MHLTESPQECTHDLQYAVSCLYIPKVAGVSGGDLHISATWEIFAAVLFPLLQGQFQIRHLRHNTRFHS